jgi:hypothetical protein
VLRSIAKRHLDWRKPKGFLLIKKLITFNHNPKGDLHNGIRQRTDRLTQEMIEQLKADLKTAKTYQDLMGENGDIKKIIKASLEGMLDAELTEHPGYEKYSHIGKNTGNSRNGKTYKTLKNNNGEIELTVPRDRNGTFDPVIVKKYERTLVPIEDKIISMPTYC